MYRNVGVLLALLAATQHLRVLAAGNIGCLFSETLCEGEREWCFDDHAFGHCLSDYGHYREEDLYRYELGSEELRHLEQEMQRLFLLGYRWSHTYTQCVLQTLLHSIRRKIEFDISSCNGDLDQDLEGALRAIEGEELEQIDPRDLAIVRFTPSATDPHSDYADEVYFPPIKDQLQDHHPDDQSAEDHDHQDSESSRSNESSDRTGDGRTGGGGDKEHSLPPKLVAGSGPLKSNPPGPPPPKSTNSRKPVSPEGRHAAPDDTRALNYINYYGGNSDGYDDEYQSPYHYQTPVNPVYRKRGMMQTDNINPYQRGMMQTDNINPYQRGMMQADNINPYQRGMMQTDNNNPHQRGMMQADNINPYQRGMMQADNINSHQRGMMQADNINPYQRGMTQADNINPYQRGMTKADNISPLQRGMMQADNINPLQRGMMQADNINPLQRGMMQADNINPLQRGMMQADNINPLQRGMMQADNINPLQRGMMQADNINPLQRGMMQADNINPHQRGMMQADNISKHQLSLSELKQIAGILDDMRVLDNSYNADESVIYPENFLSEEDREEEEEEGVFGEEPTRPRYTESGVQFIPELDDQNELMDSTARDVAFWQNLPANLRVVPGGYRNVPEDLRNIPGGYRNIQEDLLALPGGYHNVPEDLRNIPGVYDNLQNIPGDDMYLREEMRNIPDDLRNYPGMLKQYDAQEVFLPENIEPDDTYARYGLQDDSPYEASVRDLPRDALLLEDEINSNSPRVSAIRAAFGPQLNNLQDYEEELQDYPDYDDLDENDEDYLDQLPAEYNFQRAERLDVKKPGPFFKTVNNYAFEYTDDAEDRAGQESGEGDGVGGGDVLLTRLLEDGPRIRSGDDDDDVVDEDLLAVVPESFALRQQVPDLLLAAEGLVEEPVEDNTTEVLALQQEQQPSEQRQPDEQEGSTSTTEPLTDAPTEAPRDTPTTTVDTTTQTAPSSYVYITINGRFRDWEQANSVMKMVVVAAGLQMTDIDKISVDKDEVAFHVKENSGGVTAADVAKKAEDMRDYIKSQIGVDINQTGVGSKTTMSAVVFSSSEKHILAAAAIVCGVMAALLVAATVLFFLRRHAKSKAKLQGLTAHDTEASKDYQELCRARMGGKAGEGGKPEPPTAHVPSQRVSSLSKDSDNGNNSPSSRSSTSSWSEEPVASNMDISTGHMVLSYMEDHLKNKDRLEQEWIALCAYEAEPCATTLALKPENNLKNRYPDAVPYDHNRVVLTAHANLNGSDYINASSITDHDPRNPAYIATQGPLESTAADFWQLVWEQGSVVIVMLTRLTENGHAFCHRYWPEEGSDLYHIYEVHLVSEHIWCDDYLVRSFYLKNVRTGETRTVTQFHFLSWPDSGTPASTKALLEFRRKVNKSYRGRSCPIIVHCSDGIGRTGTYCLIDMVLNRMAKGAKEIDIAATLEHIRDQRPHMVKSKAQFEFVLMAVAEEVHAILKALPQ